MTPTFWFIVSVASIGVMLAFVIAALILYKRAFDLNPLLATKEGLERDIEAGNETKTQLEGEMKELETKKASAQEQIAEAQYWKKWMEENSDTVSSLKTQISNTQDEIESINKKRDEAEASFEEKSKQLTEVNQARNEELAKMEQIKREQASLVQQINENENQLTALKQDTDRQQSVYEDLIKQKQQCQNEIDHLTREQKRLEDQLKAMNLEIEAVKEKKLSIQSDLASMEGTVNSKRVEQATLSEKIAGLEQRIKETEGEDRWVDLDTPYIVSRKVNPSWKTNEEDWLKTFQDNLKKSGIVFSDRIIKAFHTSLKVEEYSPLVVLAGISGTGKSLLPQLYAKALGMNFLQVAVQPRWDSPQDMFGFYNYMQGKYKATELSRLLWQYDPYNNKHCVDRNLLPMNLILLDEMNLARVEYYFSDMLSKLEVRRNINPEKAEDRKTAEIELESGPSKLKEATRRLFVNANTLFVGTMNEDETTQALSDKVMDRANVLRFGKPNELQTHVNLNIFNNAYADEFLMPFSFWKTSWTKKTMPSSDEDHLRGIMNHINDVMSQIGRPFAHRVWQAVQNYVSQYPRMDDGHAFNHAVADQIEMKILPKLNGVEKTAPQTDAALKQLQRLIDELDDEELSQTFHAVCEDTSSAFFQWRGVSRS